MFLIIVIIHHQHPASTSSPRHLRFPHSMTWQRFNTWQRCCSASKRFTNASDPGASRLAAAWDNEAKKCSRTPFSTQSSSHQKLCIIFVIFLKYVNSKHVKTHSRLKLTRSLHLSVPGSFSSFHPISIRCTNLSCSTRQLCSCTIHLTFAAEDPPVSELVPLKSSLPPWPHESVAGRHQIGGFVAKPNIEAHNM